MKKSQIYISLMLLLPLLLSGCSKVGEKSSSIAIIYGTAAVISLLMLAGYCFIMPQKDPWFLLLYSCVLIVNVGYFSLAVSPTLELALWANRISYFGSVFLPVSMIMITHNLTKLKYKKWIAGLLLTIAVFVFLVAASPGILDIYYKEAYIESVGGITILKKVYGPWHSLYFVYLLGCFASLIATVIIANVKKKMESNAQAAILTIAVTVNMLVWLFEQLVSIDFEILSISYIISEAFLLCLYLMVNETELKLKALQDLSSTHTTESADSKKTKLPPVKNFDSPGFFDTHCRYFAENLPSLTHTERIIYDFYNEGKSTKEIMRELNITENTLKYHNKNIYGKLGVSSRKQLIEIARAIKLAESESDQL